MEFGYLDAGLVPAVIVTVELLKKRVADRWVPLLPFGVSLVFSFFAAAATGLTGFALAAKTAVEALKMAFAAMGLWKLYHTTIRGE